MSGCEACIGGDWPPLSWIVLLIMGRKFPHTRVVPKVEKLYQNMILYKDHPIFYTNRNIQGAPKAIRESRLFLRCAKSYLIPSKVIPFLLLHRSTWGYWSKLLCLLSSMLYSRPIVQHIFNCTWHHLLYTKIIQYPLHNLYATSQCTKRWSTSSPVHLHM